MNKLVEILLTMHEICPGCCFSTSVEKTHMSGIVSNGIGASLSLSFSFLGLRDYVQTQLGKTLEQ